MVNCVSGLQNIKQMCAFRILRPTSPILTESKSWWQYAAKCHGFTYRNSDEKWRVAKENLRYISIYKRLLTNPSESISKEERQLKVDIEKNRSLNELTFLRNICCDSVSANEINIRNRNIMHGKGILYHWFPNWLGWYGVSDNTNVNALSQLGNDETYKNIEDDILIALKESIENDTFSKRDAIFGYFTFSLSNGRIALMSNRCEKNVVLLDMELQNLFCFVEVKPKVTSYRVGISLGSVSLNDKLTDSTEFPFLIKPQNHENQNNKSLYNEFLNFFTKKDKEGTDGLNEDPWFQLQYERCLPENQADYSLTIKSKSIDVVYNEYAFKWLVSFFNQPINNLKSFKNVLKESKNRVSSLKFFKNWKSVLLGQKDNRKKWTFEIDISAPRIICVENFKDKNGSVVLIDFGRFQLFKNERSSCGVHVADADSNGKDSDDDLFMTPCSTPPGSQISRAGSPIATTRSGVASIHDTFFTKVIINNDTGLESELYSEIYDKYIINLTELQVLVCKSRECGYACSKSSSNFHLLDKFNISLHLERRIINTSDPEYPSIKLYGNLNKIVAHVNEQKISECLRILSPITLNFFKKPTYLESTDTTPDDTYEGFEFSNATIFQFVIGQIILEVQSRAKSIAEIQVIGAKAGITKKCCEVIINMSVHGFLLVDAIQSFGPDFELLIASHRHVEMDSISGSLKQSEPCSPNSPGSPDPNGYHRCASPHVINRAVNDLHTEIGLKPDDDDALISIDFSFLNSLADSEPLQIANITFNNLDVIANQETIVELLGFGKRILDNFRMLKTISKNEERIEIAVQNADSFSTKQLKTEISFDFHRLNILVLRSTRVDNVNVGRKVGTLTMSEAKIHATLGKEICISGALGGIQVIDITPEGFNHQRIFSVGKDPLTDSPKFYSNDILYTLTNEMYGNDLDEHEFQYTNALSFKLNQPKSSDYVIKIRMASVWYTHCPRFIEEIYLCVNEFKEYFKNFVTSIRSKASYMAKGLVKHSWPKSCSKFGELSLDIALSSPVLVLPRSCQSNEVLVANLGTITVCNSRERITINSVSADDLPQDLERDTYFIDVRNINLFSLNTCQRKTIGIKVLPKANEMYSCQSDAVPILHDTALLFQCIHETKATTIDNGWDICQSLLVS